MSQDALSLFVKKFDIELDDVFRDRIYIMGKKYFLSNKHMDLISKNVNRDIFSKGIYLGEEKGHFIPSPALIDMISKMNGADKKKIIVNSKAEWMFLCKRNVLNDSIVKNQTEFEGGFVFVQNDLNENLGYGTFERQGPDVVIKNLLDKGAYLRYNEKRRK